MILSIVAASHIKLSHDIEFWHKIKNALEIWNPENHPEDIEITKDRDKNHERHRMRIF